MASIATRMAQWTKGWTQKDWVEFAEVLQDLVEGRSLDRYADFIRRHNDVRTFDSGEL